MSARKQAAEAKSERKKNEEGGGRARKFSKPGSSRKGDRRPDHPEFAAGEPITQGSSEPPPVVPPGK